MTQEREMEPGKPQASRLLEYEPRSFELSRSWAGGSYLAAPAQEFRPREYWNVLRKRRWTVLCATLVVTSLSAIASLRMTPLYEAAARLAIFKENDSFLGFKDTGASAPDDWDYSIDLDTQVRILQSDTVAWDVIQKLHLDTKPAFAGKLARRETPVPATAELSPEKRAALIAKLRAGLRVAVLPKTRIVEIRYASPQPRMAAEVANAFGAAYIESNFKTKFESTMQTSDWLSRQLADLQIKVETAQEKLVRYQKETGILGLDDKQNIITAKLEDLNKELTGAQADRIQKEANYRLAQSGNPDLTAKPDAQNLLEKLREQEADLKGEYARATAQFGPAYPRVVQINSQLAQVESAVNAELKRISEKIRQDYLAAEERERLLRAALENQKGEANRLSEKAIQYSILKRDVDTSRQLYDGLLQKLKEAGVAAGLKSGNVRIVDAAQVPAAPSRPNIPLNMEFGLAFGLMGGIALAFLLEGLDNTVRTPEQVQLLSGAPCLGIVPLEQRLLRPSTRPVLVAGTASPPVRRVELVTHELPNSQAAECYRALRTSILLSSAGGPPKLIVVTSALPQEGKTSTSLNCGIVLAQKGARVLLLDADLRRPGVHHALHMHPRVGLSSVLTGSVSLQQAIRAVPETPNLYVLPSGPAPPHPAELLASGAMRNLLHRVRAEFDHVLIDTPPALTVTDAVLLSVEADAVIVVARAGQTTKEALRRIRELLFQVNAKFSGVVLNGVDLHAADSHHYYYYYGSQPEHPYYSEQAASQ